MAPHVEPERPLAEERCLIVRPRATAALVVGAAVCAAASRVLPPDFAGAWMARVIGAGVAVAVVPGALALLAWRPRQSFTLLELLGFGLAVSFVLAHLLTVGALVWHWSPAGTLAVLALVAAAHAAAAFRRGDGGVHLRFGRGEIGLLVVLLALGAYLYAAGSPFRDQEDRIHISIVQRLSRLAAPAVDNIYLSPGVVYTYPFPATHYMMALMARLGDIEPMFLYHKLRALWGVAAMILLYACARVVFGRARVALAIAIVVAAFVGNGTFAAVPGMYWGQMTPYSHASDVAMGVLLPAALLVSFAFLRAPNRREAAFFLAVAAGMAFMLVVVHPREVVQLMMYVSVLLVMAAIAGSRRAPVGRVAALAATSLSTALAYRVWYQRVAGGVEPLVRERRESLWSLFTENSWSTLVGAPLPLLSDYMPVYDATFRSWNPVVLLVGPVVLYLYRDRWLAWLLAGSIGAYLLIMRLPLIAIAYAYATYFEILYTPVRNVVFFVYLLAGAGAFALAAWLSRRSIPALLLGAALASWATLWLFRDLGPIASGHSEAFLVVLLLGYAAAALVMIRSRAETAHAWLREPRPRWAAAFAVWVAAVAIGTYSEESAIVRGGWREAHATPGGLLASLECRDNGQFCPPPPALIEFVRTNVPAEAILATDYHEAYEATLFMPQQLVVWSGATEGLAEAERPRVFGTYFVHLARAHASSVEQPLFNDQDTLEERLSFLRDLAVTHVLVNPRLYPSMRSVFAQYPELFVPRFDEQQWALYQVTLP